MPERLLSSLAALGIALAPALLKFADVPKDSSIEVNDDAEVECINQADSPVHDHYQGATVEAHLPEGSVVQVLSKRKNWRHVAYVNGEQADVGWVTTTYLAACDEEPKAPGTTEDEGTDNEEQPVSPQPHPSSGKECADDLASCPPNGCAAPGTPHALLNELKKRTTAADGSSVTFDSATPIAMSDMAKLQTRASSLVSGKDLDAEERDRIAHLKVGNLTLGEGVPVRLAGFLAPHESGRPASGVHLGSVESVNCKLSEPTQLDFHIPLLENLGDEECAGVVVEMIPQGREAHPAWTTEALWKIEKEHKPVLFVGPLFYDNEHLVNDDCSALKKSQPRRMSLWEIHPVVEFYVCDKGHCDASSKTGWRRVD